MDEIRDVVVDVLPEFLKPEEILTLIDSAKDMQRMFKGKWQSLLDSHFDVESTDLNGWSDNLLKELFQVLTYASNVYDLLYRATSKDAKIFRAVVDILEEVEDYDRILICMYLDARHLADSLSYFRVKFEPDMTISDLMNGDIQRIFYNKDSELTDYLVRRYHPKYQDSYHFIPSAHFTLSRTFDSIERIPGTKNKPSTFVNYENVSLGEIVRDMQRIDPEYVDRNDISFDPVSDTINLFVFCQALYDYKYTLKDIQPLIDALRCSLKKFEAYCIEQYLTI